MSQGGGRAERSGCQFEDVILLSGRSATERSGSSAADPSPFFGGRKSRREQRQSPVTGRDGVGSSPGFCGDHGRAQGRGRRRRYGAGGDWRFDANKDLGQALDGDRTLRSSDGGGGRGPGGDDKDHRACHGQRLADTTHTPQRTRNAQYSRDLHHDQNYNYRGMQHHEQETNAVALQQRQTADNGSGQWRRPCTSMDRACGSNTFGSAQVSKDDGKYGRARADGYVDAGDDNSSDTRWHSGGVKRTKWHDDPDLERRPRVGKKFFKPLKPPEDPLDLWCGVCQRNFQDTNSKLSHDRSKKHRQAMESAREMDKSCTRMDEQESDGAHQPVQTYFVETNLATTEKLSEMIKSGAHENAPKPFKDWANRSISAAQARDDPALFAAVVKEIADELFMQNERSTIHITNWATRDNATGMFYLGAKPLEVTVPLFDAEAVDNDAFSGVPEPSAGPSSGHDVHQSQEQFARPDQIADQRSPTPPDRFHSSIKSIPPVSVDTQTDVSPASVAVGRLSSHPRTHDIGPDLSVPEISRDRLLPSVVPAVVVPDTAPIDPRLDLCKDQQDHRADVIGYRCKPSLPQDLSVPPRRRMSAFQPKSSAAMRLRDVCRPKDRRAYEILGLVYEREYPAVLEQNTPIVNGPSVEGTAVLRSNLVLQNELDCLYDEFSTGYNFAEFSAKLRSIVIELECKEMPYSVTLRRAYELQIDTALLQDMFEDLVEPCARLIDVYGRMKDVYIGRRDEFIAYYCISLLLSSSKPRNLVSKYDDRAYHALPGLLAKGAAAGPHGVLTRHAITVVTAVLCGNWTSFFKLRAGGFGYSANCRGLEIAMDGLVDVVRSNALHAIYYGMDRPATIPFQNVLEQLMWFSTGRETGSTYWHSKDAREFVSKVGCSLVASSDHLSEDGSTEFFICSAADEAPGHRLETVLGAANPEVIFGHRRSARQQSGR